MECVTKILLLYTDAASRILAVSPLTCRFICMNICYVTLIVDCQRIHRVSQLLLLFIASFQGIYSYPLQTNHVCRVSNVAAILWSQCMLRGMLFPIINVFYFTLVICYFGAWSSVVVKTLRYWSDGPGIDSRWCQWGFFFRGTPDRTMCPEVDSASESEYQGFLLW
jgi:hypothetical protein